MRKWLLLVIIGTVVIGGYVAWSYMSYRDYLGKTVHETDRWVVITDSHGDFLALETTSDQVWSQLVALHQNQTEMWIGGILEEYSNTWGFRFQPDTIIIAQITIEAAQSTIQGISNELDYWINTWARETYVLARVTEIHGFEG